MGKRTPSAPTVSALSRLPKRDLVALAASVLATREQLADRAGLSFGNRRNLNKVFGYPEELRYPRFRAEHRRDGLAKRIVNLPPQATWAGEVGVFEATDPNKETDFEKTFRQLAQRTRLFRYCRRVDLVAGLGRYACMLIGGPGKLEDPLEKLKGPDDIKYLAVYSEGSATIKDFDWDENSARYGKPKTYEIKLGDAASRRSGGRDTAGAPRPVHWSRIIHVAQNLVEDDVFGSSDLEAAFNRLQDMAKTVGSPAEALWHIANRGIAWVIDKDATVSDEMLTKMSEELDEFEHDVRRNVKGKGLKPHVLGSASPDPRGVFEVVASLISAATGIPQRILFGSERGQLASLEDRLNWGGLIDDRRQNYAEPDILRAMVDRFVEIGALPKPKDDYLVEWPSAVTLSDDERATIALKISQAIRNVADAGAATGRVVASLGEFRERWLRLDPELPDDVVAEAMEDAEEPVADTPDAIRAARKRRLLKLKFRRLSRRAGVPKIGTVADGKGAA